jgi:hypothetical protein
MAANGREGVIGATLFLAEYGGILIQLPRSKPIFVEMK